MQVAYTLCIAVQWKTPASILKEHKSRTEKFLIFPSEMAQFFLCHLRSHSKLARGTAS